MSEFENWFEAQDFYTNMRFIHGDKLFHKDGDAYRVLPVQMTYKAWIEKQANVDRLREMNRRYIGKMQEQQDQIAELKTQMRKLDSCVDAALIKMTEFDDNVECETLLTVDELLDHLNDIEEALRGEHE